MPYIHFEAGAWYDRFDTGFNDESVVRVADALGLIWGEKNPDATVYVGYDTRHLGIHFAELFASVLSVYGLSSVVSKNPCPLPALSFACAGDADACGCVMITGSEQSCEIGGIAVRGADGGPVDPSILEAVERYISLAPSGDRARSEVRSLEDAYIETLVGGTDIGLIESARPTVVIDSMYGSTRGVAKTIFERVGCNCVEIHAEASQDFGGIHPEPAMPWTDDLEQAVLLHGANLGIALGGDGNRLCLVDETGRSLSAGEQSGLLIAHEAARIAGADTVVASLSSSSYVRLVAEDAGLVCREVPVGFKRIYDEMSAGGCLMGVEEHGGIAYATHIPERDGIYAALRAVEMVCGSGSSLGSLRRGLRERYGDLYSVRRDLHVEAADAEAIRNMLPGINPKSVCGKVPTFVSHTEGLYLAFDDDSWIMVRPSRRSPLIRVRAEARSEREAQDVVDAVVRATVGR